MAAHEAPSAPRRGPPGPPARAGCPRGGGADGGSAAFRLELVRALGLVSLSAGGARRLLPGADGGTPGREHGVVSRLPAGDTRAPQGRAREAGARRPSARTRVPVAVPRRPRRGLPGGRTDRRPALARPAPGRVLPR